MAKFMFFMLSKYKVIICSLRNYNYISREIRAIKSRRLIWAGHVARMEKGRSSFKILTGKPTGKRPLGRPRRRWEDNIRMDLKEIGINAGNWVRIGIIGERH